MSSIATFLPKQHKNPNFSIKLFILVLFREERGPHRHTLGGPLTVVNVVPQPNNILTLGRIKDFAGNSKM